MIVNWKWDSLCVCLGFSILIHGLALCAIVLCKSSNTPQMASEQDHEIVITMVAAPADLVETPKPELARSTPPKPEPRKTMVLDTKSEPVAPVALAETPVSEEVPKLNAVIAVAKPLNPEGISGDGSSPKPGLDATTSIAPVLQAHPSYLKNPDPPHPPAARRRHQEGLVVLLVKISVEGRARNIRVKNSSGFPLLDQAALQAVSEWKFEPARAGSTAVASEIEVPVRFKIEN